MFRCKRAITIAVLVLASIGARTAGARTPERLFLPLSLDQAMALAAKNRRIVFVDFSTAWCGACKRLDEDTWTNGKVVEQLKQKTIPLKLDGDKDRNSRDKYKIDAYPTLLFLNPDGSILARVVGYQIPARFIATLQGVLTGNGAGSREPKRVEGDH